MLTVQHLCHEMFQYSLELYKKPVIPPIVKKHVQSCYSIFLSATPVSQKWRDYSKSSAVTEGLHDALCYYVIG